LRQGQAHWEQRIKPILRALPVDVLRAFVAVVNARGFTRAAEELGRTQPTISLQVKRLEELIEAPLFENSSRLTLTKAGEICLDYSQRILHQHDELFARLARIQRDGSNVRLGLASEIATFVMEGLGDRLFQPGANGAIEIACDLSENLVAEFRLDRFEMIAALLCESAGAQAQAEWRLPLAWACAPSFAVPRKQPLPLIAPPENSCLREIAGAALKQAGRSFEIVCVNADPNVLKAAAVSGAGIMPIARAMPTDGLVLLSDEAIAPLPDAILALFVAPGAAFARSRGLASNIAALLAAAGYARVAA
jgi:DNA-binding transcriptional LysR family regulator